MSQDQPFVSVATFLQSLSQPYEDGKMTMLRGMSGSVLGKWTLVYSVRCILNIAGYLVISARSLVSKT